MALKAGVDTIEHMVFSDDETDRHDQGERASG